MIIDLSTENRFWQKVQKAGPDDCWIWQGAQTSGKGRQSDINLSPYGEFKLNGKVERAHRVAWLLTFGEIPETKEACHTCDNRLCCNPTHLFLGTHLENMKDMFRKGRGKGFLKRPVMLADDPELMQQIRGVLTRMKQEGKVSLSQVQREVFGDDDPRGGKHFQLIQQIWIDEEEA